MIDSSGPGNSLRVRLADCFWNDQPLGTASTPPCHVVSSGTRSPRGLRAGLAPKLGVHRRELSRVFVCHRHLF